MRRAFYPCWENGRFVGGSALGIVSEWLDSGFVLNPNEPYRDKLQSTVARLNTFLGRNKLRVVGDTLEKQCESFLRQCAKLNLADLVLEGSKEDLRLHIKLLVRERKAKGWNNPGQSIDVRDLRKRLASYKKLHNT